MQIGILGCGDFLRWQASSIGRSSRVAVRSLFDPDHARAERFASQLGGRAVGNEDEIFQDPEIDTVCLFVPPWVRRGVVEKAARAGKHILTTKPLAPTVADCEAIARTIGDTVRCGVIYRRTECAMVETAKSIFEGGELGRLALYRQDWLHHYPQWNRWALDPAKNGGPFMDAMIHNLNIARYLMGRPVETATFTSDRLSHPNLTCADTESMRLKFAQGGVADLFITWAADLAVHSTDGNNREHIDIMYMITDHGWRLTEGKDDEGRGALIASRAGETRVFPYVGIEVSVYDRFAASVADGAPLPRDLPGVAEAAEDIALVRAGAAEPHSALAGA